MSERACEICGGHAFRPLFAKDGYAFQRCRRCGLERIHPQPGTAALEAIYGRRYYEAWGAHADEELSRQLKKATFRRHLAAGSRPAPGAQVLDCGAGLGFFLEAAAEAGLRPYGAEISDYGAGRIARRFGPERVFCGPFEAAHFPGLGPGAFAACFMFDFLEHVRDPENVLRKAHAWLAPGGRLVICTPNTASLSRRLMGASWLHFKPEHLFYFHAANLGSLLRRVGFADVRSYPAHKTMNLEYVRHQMRRYRHWFWTRLSAATKALPAGLRSAPFAAHFGEMVVVARRGTGPQQFAAGR